MSSTSIYHSLARMKHAPYKLTEVTVRYQVPFFNKKLFEVLESLWWNRTPTNISVKPIPHMFNWIKVGTHSWPFHLLNVQFSHDSSAEARYVSPDIVVQEYEFRANSCCGSICSMYPAAVRLPRTTRSIGPSILMPTHTITEPCPNRSPSWTTFGMYCSPRRPHTRWRPSRCVRGNLDLSMNNKGLHWRSYQSTWLRTNRRRAAQSSMLNGILEQDVWAVRTLLLTCSLLSGQTPWLQWPSWGLIEVLWQLLNDAATHRWSDIGHPVKFSCVHDLVQPSLWTGLSHRRESTNDKQLTERHWHPQQHSEMFILPGSKWRTLPLEPR
jgi:hypothetical protein